MLLIYPIYIIMNNYVMRRFSIRFVAEFMPLNLAIEIVARYFIQ